MALSSTTTAKPTYDLILGVTDRSVDRELNLGGVKVGDTIDHPDLS